MHSPPAQPTPPSHSFCPPLAAFPTSRRLHLRTHPVVAAAAAASQKSKEKPGGGGGGRAMVPPCERHWPLWDRPVVVTLCTSCGSKNGWLSHVLCCSFLFCSAYLSLFVSLRKNVPGTLHRPTSPCFVHFLTLSELAYPQCPVLHPL